MKESIPHLEIELLPNGNIRLENESMGDSYVVDLHPMHLRFIAERLGLVRAPSTSEADALRMVDKLARRLKVLHDRIHQLDRWLWDHPDHEEADISTEIWFSAATLELSNEFQSEVAESGTVVTPRHAMSRTPRDASVSPVCPATVPRDTAGTKPSANPAETQRVTAPGQLDLAP